MKYDRALSYLLSLNSMYGKFGVDPRMTKQKGETKMVKIPKLKIIAHYFNKTDMRVIDMGTVIKYFPYETTASELRTWARNNKPPIATFIDLKIEVTPR